MRIRNRKINPTMLELIYGILAYGVVVLILMTVLELCFNVIEKVFNDSFLLVLIGFFIGISIALILVVMMTRTIENIVEGGGYFFVSINAIIKGMTMPNIINTIVSIS